MAHSGKTMTFATDLLPNEDGIYNLGSASLKWNIYGTVTGNATNVTGTVAIANGGTGATTAVNARTNLGLGSIAIKNDTDYLPVNYSAINFSSTSTTHGVYPMNDTTHPVTTSKEFGGLIQFGASSTSNNYYAAQLLISSVSGASSSVHAYIRRMTSTPGWSGWTTLLDNKNTTAPSSVPTLSWGNESTVFTLNGSAVKIKAMAKPTYAFTDLTSHPTTISGYGITDAKINSGIITLGSNTITPITSIADLTGSTITTADLKTKIGIEILDWT